MNELVKIHAQNAVNLTYVTSVCVGYIDDIVTILAGVTLIWWNVERALQARNTRQK